MEQREREGFEGPRLGGEEGECKFHDTLPPEAGACTVDDSVAGESHSETNRDQPDWQKEAPIHSSSGPGRGGVPSRVLLSVYSPTRAATT